MENKKRSTSKRAVYAYDKVITVNVGQQLKKRVRSFCDNNYHIPLSRLVVIALEEFLERRETSGKKKKA
jgi:hypothetical protein